VLARAAAALDREHAAGEHRVSLAASHTIGTFLLPQWLAAFTITAPAVRPQVSVVNSGEVLAAVQDRDVDIGFVPDPAPLEGLDALGVGQDELVVVVGARHRWARAGDVPPAQTCSEPFFTREKGSGTRATAIEAVRSLGIELQPELETSSTEALKRTVLGGGFTIMSLLAIGDELSANQLRALRIKGAPLHREHFAVKRDDRQLKLREEPFSPVWRVARRACRAPAASRSARRRRPPCSPLWRRSRRL
jgi:DNA-binding transcriptional LysR family regulator